MSTKPEIEFPTGPAPTELTITDLVVGEGAEAVPGATVDVHYVGVEYDTGEEFDSSWNRGESISFPLRGLIQGWQDGIPGMRVGGRRQLIIPPEQAYGPAGAGHRLSGVLALPLGHAAEREGCAGGPSQCRLRVRAPDG